MKCLNVREVLLELFACIVIIMCFKKKRVYFMKGNENKRLYFVLLFLEDLEKNF